MMVVIPDSSPTKASMPHTVNTVNGVNTTAPSDQQPPVQNGQMDVPNVSPKTYQMLLQQVENLRKENNTLKAELKNNTSHINKLENEASSLKDMVILFGISGGSEVEGVGGSNSINTFHARTSHADENACLGESPSPMWPKSYFGGNSLAGFHSPLKVQPGCDQNGDKQHLFDLGLGPFVQPMPNTSSLRADVPPPSHNGITGSVSPTPSTAVADAIRKAINNLMKDRANILRSFQCEEQTKDYYMKQLKELNHRLDNVSESDKYTKPNDKTRQQLEVEIANLKRKMEQSLGTSDVMEERLQGWLKRIQETEKEIQSLTQHLRKLDATPTSSEMPGFLTAAPRPECHADEGSCTKHGSYLRGTVSITEISTQTPHLSRMLDGIIYEEEFSACDSWNSDVQISAGGGRVSRPAQTIASCLTGRAVQNQFPVAPFELSPLYPGQHDPLGLRMEPKPPGSVESLPSHPDMDDTASMHSFTTSLPRQFQANSIGNKKDCVQSPSSLLSANNREDICRILRQKCLTPEGCFTLRQGGCITVIVKMIHDGSLLNLPSLWSSVGAGRVSVAVSNRVKIVMDMRLTMGQTLKNVVRGTSDATTKAHVEAQILNQLEMIRGYCEKLFKHWLFTQTICYEESEDTKDKKASNFNSNMNNSVSKSDENRDKHKLTCETVDCRHNLLALYKPPMSCIYTIMKMSHNEAIRSVISELGGLYAVAELFVLHCRCVANIEQVCSVLGAEAQRPDDDVSNQLLLLRRYVGFALINLTYGDMANKAILIQMPGLIDMVMAQIETESEEMQQVMARFLWNLSRQPDQKCRDILRQKSVVTVLMQCALSSKRENTLKSVLSALWNLSAHCPENRASICAVKGALAFLVSTLTYRSQSKSKAIIESGGGILQNISSVVATNEEYRQILRENNCLPTLLNHLKAASLTIVSNACGTLWNLSARSPTDQKQLRELGAVNMLRNLVHSKHSVIAQGSNAALRNLLANRPENNSTSGQDLDKTEMNLQARKEAALHPGNTKDARGHGNFSPRLHAWVGNGTHEKLASPKSTLSPQRRSLQETSSTSPAAELEKARFWKQGGLHYSGSLGSLPNTEFGDSFSKSFGSRYVPAARNSNSHPEYYSSKLTSSPGPAYPGTTPGDLATSQLHPGIHYSPIGGVRKDVMMFNEQLHSPLVQNQTSVKTQEDKSGKNFPQTKFSLEYIMSGGKLPHSGTISSIVSPPQYKGIHSGVNTLPNLPASRGFRDPSPSLIPQSSGMLAENPHNVLHTRSRSDIVVSHSQYQANGAMQKLAWNNSQSGMIPPNGAVSEFPHVHNVKGQVMGLSRVQRNPNIPQNMKGPIQNPDVLRLAKSGCPEDLARRLQNVEDTYNDDDDLVNYSLQYRDEHMTPGIRSPRTEEIYDTASNTNEAMSSSQAKRFMHSQMGGSAIPSASTNGLATPSDGGLSGLSSCIGSTGSSAAQPRPDTSAGLGMSEHQAQGVPDRSQNKFHGIPNRNATFTNERMLDPMYYNDEDEKPTDFGAIYSEEQIFEPIQTATAGMIMFPGIENQQEQQFLPMVNQASNAIGPPDPQRPSVKIDPNLEMENKNEYEQEEDDKFDTGAITPGHCSHHKSGRNSGFRTPLFEGTPLIYSRSSSLGSVGSCEAESFHSSVTSDPGSRMMSGLMSPSQLPDSPSQSMPVSPRQSPPPEIKRTKQHPQHSEPDNRNEEMKTPQADLQKSVADEDPESRQNLSEAIDNRLSRLKSPGYTSSLPQNDEMSGFKSEGSMSVMTSFSALTIDSNDKVRPMLENAPCLLSEPSQGNNSITGGGEEKNAKQPPTEVDVNNPGQLAVMNAGYITSLPTNDEIKNFMHEGSVSPMTSFSEISCLKECNNGFHRETGSVFSGRISTASNSKGGSQSMASNKNSFASRSSATGASVPPPAPERWLPGSAVGEPVVQEEEKPQDARKDSTNVSSLASPTSNDGGKFDLGNEEDSDSLPSSYSDDEDLLKRCIEHGLPKKKPSNRAWSSKSSTRSTSSKSSSKGGKSSRSKEKAKEKSESREENPSPTGADEDAGAKKEDRSATNPSPEVVRERIKRINIKQKLDAANTKLQGLHIVDYIDNLIAKTEIAGEAESSGGAVEQEEKLLTGMQKSKKVIDNVETLEQTYSVKKRLKETGKLESAQSTSGTKMPSGAIPKTTGFLATELSQNQQASLRLQSFIREGIACYATEGTPIEMSRSTSLSNLTIDSDVPDHPDISALQNRMKTSLSVPDIKSVDVDKPVPTNLPYPKPEVQAQYVPAEKEKFGHRLEDEVPVSDSREILEDLNRQIKSLSLSTAEAVITSKDPGYMTSLPQTDEIKKFASEGSQSGVTVFSALTIDSDTRIAPSGPIDGATSHPQMSSRPFAHSTYAQSSPPFPAKATNHQDSKQISDKTKTEPPKEHPESSRVRSLSGLSEDLSFATSSSIDDITVLQSSGGRNVHQDPTLSSPLPRSNSSGTSVIPLPASHYSENEPIPIREGPQTFKMEDTPLCFSVNESLSSLDFSNDGSDISNDDNLLSECISNALPAEKKSLYGPPPNQLLSQLPIFPGNNLRQMPRYDGGIPDGKVDSPTGPSQPPTHPVYHSNPMFEVQNPNLISSPTEEQWRMFERDADVVSAQLLQNSTKFSSAVHDLEKFSVANRKDSSDSFYRASLPDSDMSLGSYAQGDSHQFHDKARGRHSQESGQMKMSRHERKSEHKNIYQGGKPTKGARKHPSSGGSRQRSRNVHDSSSASSSSYPHHRATQNRHMSGSSGRISSSRNQDMCSKCHVSCPRSNPPCCTNCNPISASTGRLVENVTSPTRPRRRSTNSGSKNSARGNEYSSHYQHQMRPQRARQLAKNEYHPSITRLYPPMKDINDVLAGVASVAARGNVVVAEMNSKYPVRPSQGGQKKSSNSSSGTAPTLVKQGTFIKDKPSPVLLKNMTREEKEHFASKSTSSISSISPSQSRLSDRSLNSAKRLSPRGSTPSLKSQSAVSSVPAKDKTKKKSGAGPQAKPKTNKVWNGLKKLLSPSEEHKSIDKAASSKGSTNLRKEIAQKGGKSSKNSGRKQAELLKEQNSRVIEVTNTAADTGSSLSLSSSSVSNNSGDSDGGVMMAGFNYAANPYGHIPKSPSVNAIGGRQMSAIPQSQSTGVLLDSRVQSGNKSVWRRTPPPAAPNSKQVESGKQSSPQGGHGCISSHRLHRSGTFIPSERNTQSSSQSEASDVWIAKKESDRGKKSPSGLAAPLKSRLPVPQGQNQVESIDGGNSEAPNDELRGGTSESGLGGFLPPVRTQSPRVVQQVAPFNYNPSPKKQTSSSPTSREKPIPGIRKISPDCKQTSV